MRNLLFVICLAVLVPGIAAADAPVTNVALHASVKLKGGAFFNGGWGAGKVVSPDTVVDGVFFSRGNQWDQGPVWWDSRDGADRSIEIDLGGEYRIESFIVQADDNDGYLLYYRDAGTGNWVQAWNIPNYDSYGWGMQTRPQPSNNAARYVLPGAIITDALMIKGNMYSGDRLFSVSEVQAFGTPTECVPPPPNMVGWWQGEGNAVDIINGNNGTLKGNAGYGSAVVGQGFLFPNGGQGNVQGVKIPADSSLDARSTITIDAWIKPGPVIGPIVQYLWPGYYGAHFWLYPDATTLFANLVDVSGQWHRISAPGVIQTGVSQHVAVSYDSESGIARLYRNGAMVKEENLGSFVMKTNEGLNIGMREEYAHVGSFSGVIDEVEIFDRALTPAEIASIYGAGSFGKCANLPPVADAGPDQTAEMTSCAGADVTLDGSASSDPNGDALTYTWTENGAVIATGVNPTVAFTYGTHAVTLTVDDGNGGTATDEAVVAVVDRTAPALSVSLSPNVLWPPNHKYVAVTPSVSVSDACVEETEVALLSASSSEPDNGLGDGDTPDDIVVNADGTLSLRAERSGGGSGRTYTVTYQATDIGGNTTTASATVTVPHSK